MRRLKMRPLTVTLTSTSYIERSLRDRLAGAGAGDAQHPSGQGCSDVSSVGPVRMQIVSRDDGVGYGFGCGFDGGGRDRFAFECGFGCRNPQRHIDRVTDADADIPTCPVADGQSAASCDKRPIAKALADFEKRIAVAGR